MTDRVADADSAISSAVQSAAALLSIRADVNGLASFSEKPVFHDAVRAGLVESYGSCVLPGERVLPLPDWPEGRLGGFDVVVTEDSRYVLLGELKWCRSKNELGWTLWDMYKLISGEATYGAAGYAIVAAPDAYWADHSVACMSLYADGVWESGELFRRYWRAWDELLHGGSARPSSVPERIETRVAAEASLASDHGWTIRALRVSSTNGARVPFASGWPVGMVAADRREPDEDSVPDDRARIRGCLLGGAVGDALGAPVEFMSRAEIAAAYGAEGITTLGEAYGVVGAITDDTQMTLFTAEGLMRAQNRVIAKGIVNVPGIVWRAYLRWLATQEPGMGLESAGHDGWLFRIDGLHVRRAPGATCLSALIAGEPGSTERPLNDSKGCGGVMRVAPVGLFPAVDAFTAGCDVAALTHGHPSGYLAAGYLARLIQKVCAGDPVWLAAVTTRDAIPRGAASQELRGAIDHALTLAARTAVPTDEDVESLGEGWVAEEAVAISLYCALTARSFAEGVRLAVNHDGDSDSTGAITGNILGALWGEQAIPPDWLGNLELRDVVATIADDLAAHASGQNLIAGPDNWGTVAEDDWERYPGW